MRDKTKQTCFVEHEQVVAVLQVKRVLIQASLSKINYKVFLSQDTPGGKICLAKYKSVALSTAIDIAT